MVNKAHHSLIVKAGESLELPIACENGAYIHREITLEQGANLTMTYRAAGLQNWQETCDVYLKGERAKIMVRGIMHGQEKADLQYLLKIAHLANYTECDIEFRGVAEDKSHLVFDGLIQVHPKVVGVVANEQNRNLLLSNEAFVESRPRLEIDSNEVACRHGSTIGDLDHNQLFYLMSRGIPESEARAILIEAFLRFF